jgi:dTDP-4-dehydrorhamnose reductase
VNVTESIAKFCKGTGAKLIYISTDLVYAGYRGSYLNEVAKLIPVSLYAETKLMGEVKIREVFDNYIILRTALLFGFGLNHSKCHFQFIYEQLSKNIPVKVFVDQFRSPISVIEAAILINQMISKDIKGEIINFGGPERVSRFELAERLCDIAGLDKNLLIKTKLDEMPELPKVEDVSLNIEKMKSFGLVPKSLNEMIKEVVNKKT